jgi:hypothetical protein
MYKLLLERGQLWCGRLAAILIIRGPILAGQQEQKASHMYSLLQHICTVKTL